MIMGTPGRKFEIIRDITEDPENVLNIKDVIKCITKYSIDNLRLLQLARV